MDDGGPTDDPGWPPLWLLVVAMVPLVGIQLARNRLPHGPLGVLRMTFLAFTNSIVLFALVIATLRDPRTGPVLPWLPILAVIAGASAITTRVFAARPLDCVSVAQLLDSYRTRFFLLVACSHTVALAGFVFSFVGGPRWTYYVGGAFAFVQLWTTAAPSRSALAREDARLAATGCGLSLVTALRGSPNDA